MGNSFDAYAHDNILATQRLLEAAPIPRTSGTLFTHRPLWSMATPSGTQLSRPTHPIRLAHTG
jgi:hypothetical protein